MVLPSNASMKVHPNNTLTEYTVELPSRIHLEGKYEVAMHSIEYTRSWNNVKKGENIIKISINGISADFEIEHGYYEREQDVVDMINYYVADAIEKKERVDDTVKKLTRKLDSNKFIYLDYQKRSRHVTVFLAPNSAMSMSPELAAILGFDNHEFGVMAITPLPTEDYIEAIKKGDHVMLEAQHQVDHHRSLNMMYVYCNIITGQIVGDVFAPLLKVVPVGGEHGASVMTEYVNPQYIPVLTNQLSNITLSIRDGSGDKIAFEHGRVTVVLHFRRQSEL